MSCDGPKPAIAARGVGKAYRIYAKPLHRLLDLVPGTAGKRRGREFWALRDVSFEVPVGKTFGVIGRNGAGKSTLLQILAGVMRPTTGEVTVHGRVCALLELGSGFNPEFTGRENVRMYASILGLTPAQIAERLPEIEAFAAIGGFMDEPLKTYSTGMQMRVAFAVAIHVEPQVLIVDEALSVGDILFQKRCFDRIHQLRARGCTIVFVSHEVVTVQNICDEAMLLEQGRVMAQGPPKEVVRQYTALLFREEDRYLRTLDAARRAGDGGNSAEAPAPPPACDGQPRVADAAPALQPPAAAEGTRGAAPVTVPPEPRAGDESEVFGTHAQITAWDIVGLDGESRRAFAAHEATTLHVRVRFFKAVEHANFAYYIQTPHGVLVYETGTYHQRMRVPAVAAGQTVDVSFVQNLSLAPGHYFFNLGVAEYIGPVRRPLDRKHNALHIQVLASGTHVGGVADLAARIEVAEPVMLP